MVLHYSNFVLSFLLRAYIYYYYYAFFVYYKRCYKGKC